MIVILEGTDLVGKTTLANVLQLEQEINHYIHFGVPDKNPLDYWMNELQDIHTSAVIDRSHITHDIYRELYPDIDNKTTATRLENWIMEGWYVARGAFVIKLLPPLVEVLKNGAQNFDDKHHSADDIVKTYNAFLNPLPTVLPVINYDYTRDKRPNLIQLRESLEIRPLSFSHIGLGSPEPDVVFVDYSHDFNNKKCKNSVLLRNAGGELLRKAVDNIGFTWNDIHLTNAMWGNSSDNLKKMNIPEEWRGKTTKIVALGQKASEALNTQKIAHTYIPHPSWWNRFRNKEPLTNYVDVIMNAIK